MYLLHLFETLRRRKRFHLLLQPPQPATSSQEPGIPSSSLLWVVGRQFLRPSLLSPRGHTGRKLGPHTRWPQVPPRDAQCSPLSDLFPVSLAPQLAVLLLWSPPSGGIPAPSSSLHLPPASVLGPSFPELRTPRSTCSLVSARRNLSRLSKTQTTNKYFPTLFVMKWLYHEHGCIIWYKVPR